MQMATACHSPPNPEREPTFPEPNLREHRGPVPRAAWPTLEVDVNVQPLPGELAASDPEVLPARGEHLWTL